MRIILLHLRGVLIAVVALALSAGLAFAGHPTASFGPATAGSSLAVGDEASAGDEDVEVDETAGADGDANHDIEVDEIDHVDGTTGGTTDGTIDGTTDQVAGQAPTADTAGTNCLTDPTTLTVEELAAMSHGSIVCWAAHQTTWPAEFANHGAWVSSWAHMGKGTAAVKAKATTKAHKTKAHKTKV